MISFYTMELGGCNFKKKLFRTYSFETSLINEDRYLTKFSYQLTC